MEKLEMVQCSISIGEGTPYLLIEFNPEIHEDNILEIAEAIRYTVMRKLNCMVYMEQVNQRGYS